MKNLQKIKNNFILLIGLWAGIMYAQESCEPLYAIPQSYFASGATSEIAGGSYRISATIGQSIIQEANNYSSNSLSTGYYSYYLKEPKPPVVMASDGDFQDKVLVEWTIEDDATGPPVTGNQATLYRNGYILTTLPISQTEYQDLSVFPGEYYTYGVSTTNDMGESHTENNVGFLNPNGMITGQVRTDSGNPVINTKVILTPNLGRSAKFDGDGYVYWFDGDENTNSQYSGLENSYTIETWFRSVHNETQVFFSAVDSASTDHYLTLGLTESGQVKWEHHSTAGGMATELVTVNSYAGPGEDWHHLAVVYADDDNSMTMYIDGFLVGEGTADGPINDKAEIVMGKRGPAEHSEFYRGRLDDFRIWNTDRSWDELKTMMDITLSGEEDNLSSYWKFDEVEGETVFDLTPGKVDGKVCTVEQDDYLAPVYLGALTDETGTYVIKGIYYASGTVFTVTPSLSSPIGRSVELDGIDDYIAFEGQRVDLTNGYTIEGWFKTALTDVQTLIATVNPADDSHQVSIKMDGGQLVGAHFENEITSENTYHDNLWHHYAITSNASTSEFVFYIDGEAIGSISGIEQTPDLSEIVIARKSPEDASEYFSGRLDETRIWNNGRTQDQITGTQNQILEGDEFGLSHYWKMNEGENLLITDASSIVTGTITGVSGVMLDEIWQQDIPLNEYFDHWYEPESRAATLNPSNTSVDLVDFNDKSMIPVSGYVRYENTACFEAGVEILLNGESLIPPIFTETDGKFIIDIEPGAVGQIISTRYTNQISSEVHEFIPASIELPMMIQPMTGFYFNDKTTRKGFGAVAGGTCNYPIIPSQGEIGVTYRSIDGCIEETIIPNALGNYETSDLPPLIYNVSIEHPDPTIDETFLADTLSMKNFNRDMDFIYRSPVSLRINNLNEIDGINHSVINTIEPNECSEYPYTISSGKYFKLNYDVFEPYGDNECRVDIFDVYVTDNFSDTTYAQSVNGEFAGQSASVTFSSKSVNTIAGGTHPYQNSLYIVVASSATGTSSSGEFWALTTGTKEIPGPSFQVQSSAYPWLVLRTPPGDGSYTFMEDGSEICSNTSNSIVDGWGNESKLTASFGGDMTVIVGGIGVSSAITTSSKMDIGAGFEYSTEDTDDSTKTTCVSTTETYIAYGDGLVTGVDATVYVGGGKAYTMGIAQDLNIENCSVSIDTTISMSEDAINNTFIHSRFYIKNVMIPTAQAIYDVDGDETSLETIEYWNEVLAWDDILMAGAQNDAILAVGVEGQGEGGGDTYISFDAGASYEYSYENSSTVTATHTTESSTDWSAFTEIGLNIGGFGQNLETSFDWNESSTNSTGSEETLSRTVGFVLDDESPGDGFLFQVQADTALGMPVFTVLGGQSSCPHEDGTLERQDTDLIIDPPLTIDVPPDEAAVITLIATNTSQTGEGWDYLLDVMSASNLDGAVIKLAGMPMVDQIAIESMPANEALEIVITVERGPEAYIYDDLIMRIGPGCAIDIGDLTAIGDYQGTSEVPFSVHFLEPCSESNIANLEDGWLIDGSHGSDTLWVAINGYNFPADTFFTDIDLQYRPADGGDWFSTQSIPTVDLIDDYVLLPFNIDPEIVIDGEYELRTQAQCTEGKYAGTSEVVTGLIDRSAPQVFGLTEPAGGILASDDFIGASFDEDVQCGEINQGAGDIQLFNTVTGNPLDFTYTCGFNTITIEPAPANSWIENQTFRAEIHNLQDMYGNTRTEPVVWEFFVNRNPIEWSGTNIDNIVIWVDEEYSTQRQLVNNGGSNRSYEMINGREGAIPSGDALPLPAWLEVSPLNGTLTPGSAQDVSISLVEGLDFGQYQTTLYASGTMGDEPMNIDIRKLCYEPEWTLNPASYQYTMNITATLSTEGELSEDAYDIVGVFVGDEMRGIARVDYIQALDDLANTHAYEVFLTVYSNQPSGEALSFRVWDASDCRELGWIDETYTFEANASHGTPTSPATITATSQVISSMDYPAGYTWFSLNLENDDMSLDNILSNMNPAGGDQIKDQTSFAQYVSGFGWVGTLSEFSNESMYLINLTNPDEMEMVGYPVNVELDTVKVVPGWNWVGYSSQFSMPVNDALESLNSATGDIVKSQFAFSMFVEGLGWIGSLNYMSPKQGYMLKSLWDGDLNYPFELSGRDSDEIDEIYESPLALNAPNWNVNVNQYEHSMTVTATGLVNGLSLNSETDMIGAFTLVETENGMVEECRGVAQPIYIESLDRYSAFLMVYSNTPNEDIYYKLFDAEDDIIWSVYEQTAFSANANVGDVLTPFSLNAEPPVGDVSFDGVLNVIDVLQTVNYILDVEQPSVHEFAVADINSDEDINVADIVEMVSIILDIPMVRADNDLVVDIKVQGNEVYITSSNNIAGIQFDLPGIEMIDSKHEFFTHNMNGSLKTVMMNTNGKGINDGILFTTDDIQTISNIIVVDRSGAQLEYEVRFVPMSYNLAQNYPNPFNPETTISFDLPDNAQVSIAVYDLKGRMVTELVNGQMEAGYHTIVWNASDMSGLPLSNGVYFYRMITPAYNSVKKMVLLK